MGYTSMGFPEITHMNPSLAPMRWYKYTSYYGPINVRRWHPQSSNYVYHETPNYNYRKAFYKYPLYRKWDSKLLESLKYDWTTDFSNIPRRKISNILNQWDRYVIPIGVATGTFGGFVDILNNMNNKHRFNPHTRSYSRRLFLKDMGN